MYAVNSLIAAWLSAIFFSVPEPNYWEIMMAQQMETSSFPKIPGI